ncbi:MAG TPA: ATP-dependent DNA ligase [Candidatus Obscuribacterales bacterium]|nr:ATP-dependent DNA ligase [Candidatus Obscuribacterales bacterium]
MSKKPIKPRRAGAKNNASPAPQRSGQKASEKKRSTRKRAVETIAPMLASMAEEPFSKVGWVFEPKFDGIRAIAYVTGGEVKILSRRGLDLTRRYPELAESLEKCKEDLILDGEIVAFDEKGRTSFQLLQQASGLRGRGVQDRSKKNIPIRFYVFDILSIGGKKTITKPLSERKDLLRKHLVESNDVRRVDDLGEDGNRAFLACLENGLEGVIAKKIDSPYLPGKRVPTWLKLKATRTSEFLVCGYTEGKGSREDSFGALVLGVINADDQLVYAGSVGTGFNDSTREKLFKVMQPLKTSKCPFAVRPMAKAIASWLKPEMVVEIKYAEWTMDNKLRMPVFLQVRTDKKPSEARPDVVVPISEVSSMGEAAKRNTKKVADVVPINRKKTKAKVGEATVLRDDLLSQLDNDEDELNLEVEGNIIKLTSLNKVLFPGKPRRAKPATKRDYINYLIQVSEPLLKFTHGRPFTLIRYPNGTGGQKFFQKHWEKGLPPFVETIEYFSEHANADEEYLLCNNIATLIWCGQVASLEMHAVHSRIDTEPDGAKISKKIKGSVENIESSILNYPDFMVLDLDPYLYSGKERPNEEPELHRKGFAKTRKLALLLKEMLDNLDLNAFVKTSGKTGLHIYIPIVRNVDNDAVRQLAGTIASHVAKMRPDEVTIDWAVKKRTGRVFFDFNMNARHKTLPPPYSVRATDLANVSLPISWNELEDIYPTDFNIRNVPERLEQVGDLWEGILEEKVDLHKKLLKD